MEDCIFCKIIENKVPSFKIYEDKDVLAFLEIRPLTQGHTLIIPKKHFETIFDIDEDYLRKIVVVAKKVSEKMKKELKAEGVNLFQRSGLAAEQGVFHFHLHVVPRKKGDNINLDYWWIPKTKEASEEDLKRLAQKLKT